MSEAAQIVPGTAEMVEKLCGKPFPYTSRTVAVIEGDEVLGIGGVYVIGGQQMLFCFMSEKARAELPRRARTLLKAARTVLNMTRSTMPINAVRDPAIDGADRLLDHLGFKQLIGEVYQWPKSA